MALLFPTAAFPLSAKSWLGRCHSCPNADDRLSRTSLGRIEDGDSIIQARYGPDICPQSSIPRPLDDLGQLKAIRLNNEVNCHTIDGPRLRRPDDRNQNSSCANQARGTLADISAYEIEHEIDFADLFQSLVL